MSRMWKIAAIFGLLAMTNILDAEEPIDRHLADTMLARGGKIAVWPAGRVPSAKPGAPYRIANTNGGKLRLTDVNVPELAHFPASGSGANPAVVVCPGGGYSHLAYSHEGVEIAEWLNSNGFSAFVLKYRCPKQRDAALMDAQRAISLIRARSAELKVDPKRIGIMGFSAGANLSVRASTGWRQRSYAAVDAVDGFSCRPDFALPIYPWALLAGGKDAVPPPVELSPEYPVDDETPPAFMVQTEDDFAKVECSIAYYTALKRAGVKAEMHLFPDGGHGYGIRKIGKSVDGWENLAADWLKRNFSRPSN